MKLLLSFVICSSLSIANINCSSSQEPDPKVEACKGSCNKKMEQCVKKAANNEAKKAACEAVGNKCGKECLPKK